nr:hypothetical protein [Tanacetum cinerariifolium]
MSWTGLPEFVDDTITDYSMPSPTVERLPGIKTGEGETTTDKGLRPKNDDKDSFELNGQFLKELCDKTFGDSDHKDANEHIENVLEIFDLFHIPNTTKDQVMLRAFPMSLTRAASHWLRNKPSGSIITLEYLKTKFLSKYCPPAHTTKKMEQINSFQQEPYETLYQAWERFKELLIKCPQHYLIDAGAIQAQLNNLGREIKKVNEKVYAAQVGYEQCKGPYYTKYCPLKEEGKTLEEAYYTQFEMEQPNTTFAKIPILDTGKFEQWKFRIQQYLQNEHYALWEVIKFGDSYQAPPEETRKGSASESSTKKKGRTVAIKTEDIQKRRNDVKARTTLLLALLNEHQLRFSKYETAQELWGAILKTFGGNEATKKTKKNQLKQQYGNFKAEGSETLEQTFNKLQAIVSNLEFMDVEIEQDDLNQNFLTSLTLEWLMYTIVWRNRDDLDTMSLDDVYNHLKVYEPEVQKKSETNSQNMSFISSSNTSSRKGELHTASVLTASVSTVSTASTDVAAASLSHDIICAYIASQSNDNKEENHALVANKEVPTEFAYGQVKLKLKM